METCNEKSLSEMFESHVNEYGKFYGSVDFILELLEEGIRNDTIQFKSDKKYRSYISKNKLITIELSVNNSANELYINYIRLNLLNEDADRFLNIIKLIKNKSRKERLADTWSHIKTN